MGFTSIMGLVILADIKLKQVMRNCELKSEMKFIFSVFFCANLLYLESYVNGLNLAVPSIQYLTSFRLIKTVKHPPTLKCLFFNKISAYETKQLRN